jgi:glutamate dehydrogenase
MGQSPLSPIFFAFLTIQTLYRKTDIRAVSDPVFLEKASENTLEVYQKILWNVESRYGPVMEVFEVEGSREKRLVIGYKRGGTSKFFRYEALA